MTRQIDDRAIPVRRRKTSRRRLPIWLVAAIVGSIGLLSACTEEGQDQLRETLESASTSQGAPDDGATPQPPEEAAPTTAAPAPEPTASPEPAPTLGVPDAGEEAPVAEQTPDDEGLSTEDWILLAILGIVALVVVLGGMSVANRHSSAKTAARTELNSRLSEVVGQSRWVHDSGSIEVLLATENSQIERAWDQVRTRMVDLESMIATLAAGTGNQSLDQDLRYLGQCVSDLRGAEEGYVMTRLRASSDHAELTRTSNQNVTDRRQQLRAAIEPVAAYMRV